MSYVTGMGILMTITKLIKGQFVRPIDFGFNTTNIGDYISIKKTQPYKQLSLI